MMLAREPDGLRMGGKLEGQNLRDIAFAGYQGDRLPAADEASRLAVTGSNLCPFAFGASIYP